MAYTNLTTWDFRTTNSTDARTSRRDPGSGAIVLAATGSPTYTSNGVELGASVQLQATLNADMQPANEHGYIVAFRRIGTAGINDYPAGLRYAEPNTAPFIVLAWEGQTSTEGRLSYADGSSAGAGTNSTSGFPALNTDVVFWVNRSSISNANLYVDSATTPTLSNTFATSWQTWSASSNVRLRGPYRVAWLILYEGAMTTGERDAIIANPDDYIYPTPSGPSAAALARYRRHHLLMEP